MMCWKIVAAIETLIKCWGCVGGGQSSVSQHNINFLFIKHFWRYLAWKEFVKNVSFWVFIKQECGNGHVGCIFECKNDILNITWIFCSILEPWSKVPRSRRSYEKREEKWLGMCLGAWEWVVCEIFWCWRVNVLRKRCFKIPVKMWFWWYLLKMISPAARQNSKIKIARNWSSRDVVAFFWIGFEEDMAQWVILKI